MTPVDELLARVLTSVSRARMLITAAEVAEILGIRLQSVYDATSRGRLTRHARGHRSSTEHDRTTASVWR